MSDSLPLSSSAPPPPDPSGVCAAYTRYSDSDLQRDSSNEQQLRVCRDAAKIDGFQIMEEHHFADHGVLGSEEDRPGLNHLMDLIREDLLRVAHLYISDTSRLARDLEFSAKLCKFFDFYRVRLHFVANGMISGTSAFNFQHAIMSANDQQFSATLGQHVKRGHMDQLLKGYTPYGRCYGYRNVDAPNPSFNESFDRKKQRLGVLQIIDSVESEVVRMIYRMYLDEGRGYHSISQCLNKMSIKSPRKPTKNMVRGWGTSSIRTILSNPRYTGQITHGKLETLRHPETKKWVNRVRPESEWTTVYRPDMRIISDEDFQRVQNRRKDQEANLSKQQKGGLARSEKSRSNLFSGLLKCGACNGAINICQPETYMCTTAHRGLKCTSKLKLKRASLESHLMETLANVLRASITFNSLKAKLVTEVQRQEAESSKAAANAESQRDAMMVDLVAVNKDIDGLVSVLTLHGFSQVLSTTLRQAEARKQMLTESLGRKIKPHTAVSEPSVRDFLSDALENLAAILVEDPIRCKQELKKRINHLVLEPITCENKPAYRIRGDIRLFEAKEPMLLGLSLSTVAKQHGLNLGVEGTVLLLDRWGEILRVIRPDRLDETSIQDFSLAA